MSPKKEQDQTHGLTSQEKKVLLGEGTFISIGLVLAIVGGVAYTVNLDGRVSAQANTISEFKQDVSKSQHDYVEQMKIYNKNSSEMNTRLSRIEGKLSIPPLKTEER